MTTAARTPSDWSDEEIARLCAWSPERVAGFRAGLADPAIAVDEDRACEAWDLLDGNPDPCGRWLLGVLSARDTVRAATHGTNDLSARTAEELRGLARSWEGTSVAEPARSADNDWEWDPGCPLEPFVALWGTRGDVEAWFVGECRDSQADGRDGHWDLLVQDVREEVYVQFVDGEPQVWDGWHRIAASILKGATTIAAVVGRPCPASVPTP